MSNYIAMVSLSFASQQGERFNQPLDNPLVNPNASFTKSSCTTLISQRRTARCSKLAPDFLQRQKSIGFLPNELNKWRLILLVPPFCPQLDIIFSFFHILLWICGLKHGFVDAMACHRNILFHEVFEAKGFVNHCPQAFLDCNIEKHSTSTAHHRLTHRMSW